MPAGIETPNVTNVTDIPDIPASDIPRSQAARRGHLSLVFSAAESAGEASGNAPARSGAAGGRIAHLRRARDQVQLSPSSRALRRAVQAWALANGTPVNVDALSMVLAAKVANHVVPVALFTEDMVWQLLWIDVFTWCANRNLDVPDDIAVTLWAVLSYLDEVDGFHADSDPVAELRSPLMSSAGLGPNGDVRHPTGRRNA